jgi:hypothetical protein
MTSLNSIFSTVLKETIKPSILNELTSAAINGRWGINVLETGKTPKTIVSLYDDVDSQQVLKGSNTTWFGDRIDKAGDNESNSDYKVYISQLSDAYIILDFTKFDGSKVSNDVWIEIESDFTQNYFQEGKSITNLLATTQTVSISFEKLKVYPTKTNSNGLFAVKISDLLETNRIEKRIFNFYVRIKSNKNDFFELSKKEMRFFVIVDNIAPQVHAYPQSSFPNLYNQTNGSNVGWWEKGNTTAKTALHNEVKYNARTGETFPTTEDSVIVGFVDLFGDIDNEIINEGIMDNQSNSTIQLHDQRAPVYFHYTYSENLLYKPTPYISNDSNETVLTDGNKYHSNDWMRVSGVGSHKFEIFEYSGLTRTIYIVINQSGFLVQIFDSSTSVNLNVFPTLTKGPIRVIFQHFAKTQLYIKKDSNDFQLVGSYLPNENISHPITLPGTYEVYVEDELNYFGENRTAVNPFVFSIYQDFTAAVFDERSGNFINSNPNQNVYGPVLLNLSHTRTTTLHWSFQGQQQTPILIQPNSIVPFEFINPGRYSFFLIDDLTISPQNTTQLSPFQFNIIKDFQVYFYEGNSALPTDTFVEPTTKIVRLKYKHDLSTTILVAFNKQNPTSKIIPSNTDANEAFVDIGTYEIWIYDELNHYASNIHDETRRPFEFEIKAEDPITSSETNTSSQPSTSSSSETSSSASSTSSYSSVSSSEPSSSSSSSSSGIVGPDNNNDTPFFETPIGINLVSASIFAVISIFIEIFIVRIFAKNYQSVSYQVILGIWDSLKQILPTKKPNNNNNKYRK